MTLTPRHLQYLLCLLPALCLPGTGVLAAEYTSVLDINTRDLDARLQSLTNSHALIGDPAFPRGLRQITPGENPLVELGEILFFSQTLSGGYDTACATCHHPDFAMGDGLSLGIGVVPQNSAAVGPGRRIDSDRDLDASADGGPNMFRNSLTTMNSSLFDRVLLLDGRVQVIDPEVVPGGHGQAINTPESGLRVDADPVSGLVEFQAKGAMVTDNEMRGYRYTEYTTASGYREHMVQRLRGEVDSEFNTNPAAAENWLQLFRNGLDSSVGSATELITMSNIQRAMGAYMDSQIFIESPWKQFIEGDPNAISNSAKQGALLFFTAKEDGGLGCASCHSGDRFTDEGFHNVGFPQLGRGFRRADTTDLGRWLETRREEDRNAFRTLSLLNVALTGPWGHAGSFDTLAQTIRYHADPRSAVDNYDFSLASLSQFADTGHRYPDARGNTLDAISQASFEAAEALLPGRPLTVQEVDTLIAFLYSLTDACAADAQCLGQWAPQADQDPDGHLLVRDVSLAPPDLSSISITSAYPQALPLDFPETTPLSTFADVQACTNNLERDSNSGVREFVQRNDTGFGLNDPHGYGVGTWFKSQSSVEATMMAGGVTSAYIDDDCWPDLVFPGGELSGIRLYRNVQGTHFEDMSTMLADIGESDFSGAALADLNGDYRRELLFGNIAGQTVPVFSPDDAGRYDTVARIPMGRPTYSISFAPLDGSGYPYFYLAHWSGGGGQNGASPALWRIDAGNTLQPWDEPGGTSPNQIDQSFNFTPVFADFTGNGKMDFVITSDFGTSTTLRNVSVEPDTPRFVDDTDTSVITDENGMGTTLLDLDNDGTLEWFVTSVYEQDNNGVVDDTDYGDDFTALPINWGKTGNRLYRNVSTPDKVAFEDITAGAGVGMGYWGWGACAADFDHDGFIDIYHVNGFGNIPRNVLQEGWQFSSQGLLDSLTEDSFQNKPGLLYMNNGDGTFSDAASQWNIDIPSEGRGLSCFDYDRDGDIDITVLDHSTGLQFFENQVGHGDGRHFINIRVVGEPPNTDAIGTRVMITADVGAGKGIQTQMRISQANNNFSSQNIPDLHFGLGEASLINTLEVQWFGGESLICHNIPANQFLVIDQRDGENACP